jgi:hypothetical protein
VSTGDGYGLPSSQRRAILILSRRRRDIDQQRNHSLRHGCDFVDLRRARCTLIWASSSSADNGSGAGGEQEGDHPMSQMFRTIILVAALVVGLMSATGAAERRWAAS